MEQLVNSNNMRDAQWPNSKELYMMNGGNKLYIYKDGFADIYNATAEEEQEWAKEIIANELKKIEIEENATGLKFAIETLSFHDYPNLESLLIQKIEGTTISRQVVFATALWKLYKYDKSFDIIHRHLNHHRKECIDDVFWGLNEFRNNIRAGYFLIECLEGTDDELFSKAYTTISMWAYTGLPKLRDNNLLERLNPANKYSKTFKPAIEELKQLLRKKK